MKKLETVISALQQALLVEGSHVPGDQWALSESIVYLLDAEGKVVAAGPLGEIGRKYLTDMTEINVFAVSPNGITELRKLKRAA